MSRLLASQESLPPVEERFQKLPILLLVPGPLPKSRRILVTSGKATFFPQQKNKSTQHSDQQMASRDNINDPPAEIRCWHKAGYICGWLTGWLSCGCQCAGFACPYNRGVDSSAGNVASLSLPGGTSGICVCPDPRALPGQGSGLIFLVATGLNPLPPCGWHWWCLWKRIWIQGNR